MSLQFDDETEMVLGQMVLSYLERAASAHGVGKCFSEEFCGGMPADSPASRIAFSSVSNCPHWGQNASSLPLRINPALDGYVASAAENWLRPGA